MEYYSYVRLESAKADIRTGKETISAIAEKYAFGSIHHFSNSFKEVYGISPSDYRKKYKNL